MSEVKNYFWSISLFFAFTAFGFSQTPTPTRVQEEEKETIVTEEIKVNVAAFDRDGEFVSGVQKEDLVIVEDGRLQQASSARRVPANVLLILDTGGEMRNNLSTTRQTAKNLVNKLQASDNISVFQYSDKVEKLSDWTTDKTQIQDVLEKKLEFGRRSVLNQALDAAVKYFYQTPLENRHLILITGGTDSFNDVALRDLVSKNLIASDITVHVISYTQLQQNATKSQKSIFQEGEYKPRRLPEEIVETLPKPRRGNSKKQEVTPRDMAKMPRLGSITLDRERNRRGREDSDRLTTGEQFLTKISEDTNGEVFLPESFDEMIEKTAILAKNIDSQYVITYVPKRPLKNSPAGEIRQIEVSSRRAGLQAQASRKLITGNK
ncbi:MAG: VWA domain-containing protein [Acidobacteriota bacterium]|jgi:VWFA-related protein|nr:VWA domain-containing protein [Acidobacteriota bacterium]